MTQFQQELESAGRRHGERINPGSRVGVSAVRGALLSLQPTGEVQVVLALSGWKSEVMILIKLGGERM